jgi:hypothetical protein
MKEATTRSLIQTGLHSVDNGLLFGFIFRRGDVATRRQFVQFIELLLGCLCRRSGGRLLYLLLLGILLGIVSLSASWRRLIRHSLASGKS